MRSNLLSLQNIAGQQDIVQNCLATGLKVSSAIDNPSSYYTASSLNNRASDLTALLDAMSQSVQTIKAASEAIDSGTKFLEQAKAVANQALETAIPAKEWFAEQAGENGAVVETAQELLDAVNAGKETIVVYGKIELTHQTIELQEGQKLVGTEYFTSSEEQNHQRFSSLNINTDETVAIKAQGNNLIADLDINYSGKGGSAIVTENGDNILENLSLSCDLQSRDSGTFETIRCASRKTIIQKNIEIKTYNATGVASGITSVGGTLEIASNAKINIETARYGLVGYSIMNIRSGAELNIKAWTAVIGGFYDLTCDQILTIESDVKINTVSSSIFRLGAETSDLPKRIEIADNVQISWKNGNQEGILLTNGIWIAKSGSDQLYSGLDLIGAAGGGKFTQISNTAIKFPDDWLNNEKTEHDNQDNQDKQYCLIMTQYDSLISDAFYKGISLLNGQNLKINFNEDRSSKIDVAGVKADSESLGLKTKEWKTAEDIEKSVSELEEAINSLRSFASAFGNYYSIVTTRQDFTENLISVLEEGADKLTLADMNQESANMLALQTSQQLAVNSLSLASQASQSILRLF